MTEIAAIETRGIAVAKAPIVGRVVAAPTVVAIIATTVWPVVRIVARIRIGGGGERAANTPAATAAPGL
jgi:hypothetical protein